MRQGLRATRQPLPPEAKAFYGVRHLESKSEVSLNTCSDFSNEMLTLSGRHLFPLSGGTKQGSNPPATQSRDSLSLHALRQEAYLDVQATRNHNHSRTMAHVPLPGICNIVSSHPKLLIKWRFAFQRALGLGIPARLSQPRSPINMPLTTKTIIFVGSYCKALYRNCR